MGIAALRTRGVPRRVGRLALALLRQAKLEEFHVRTAFGFDNPADTGVVYGLLSPLLMLATARGLNLECRPMFEESGLRGAVSATVHVRPLSVVGALAAFLLLTVGHSGGRVGVAGKEMSEPRSGTPVTVGDLEIEPIERSVVRVEHVCGVIVVVAVKEPVAVILRSPRGTWRVDLASLESPG